MISKNIFLKLSWCLKTSNISPCPFNLRAKNEVGEVHPFTKLTEFKIKLVFLVKFTASPSYVNLKDTFSLR